MSEIVEVYGDGASFYDGLIGTWAWCHVNGKGERVAEAAGRAATALGGAISRAEAGHSLPDRLPADEKTPVHQEEDGGSGAEDEIPRGGLRGAPGGDPPGSGAS